MAKRYVRGHAYRWMANERVLREGIKAIGDRSNELLQFETMRSVVVEGLFILMEVGNKDIDEIMANRGNSLWWKGEYSVYLGLDKEEIEVLTAVRKRLGESAQRNIPTGEAFSIAVCEMADGRRRKHRVGGRRRIV
jgi:hypothetical protein